MFVFQLLVTYRAPLARVARHLDAYSFFQLLVTLRAPLARVARQGLKNVKKKVGRELLTLIQAWACPTTGYLEQFT